jgi:hypothetical protein
VTVRTTTDIHPDTVTRVSRGQVSVPRRPRAAKGTWYGPVIERQIDDRLLAQAIETAGGDPNRLWFGDDGAVWILNHTRATKCISAACPPCSGQ